jgi:hypothetical protein
MYPAVSEKDLLSLPFAPPDVKTEAAICDAGAGAGAPAAHRLATHLRWTPIVRQPEPLLKV